MIIIRLAGLFFAFVQISLMLRLALPFVEVPTGLESWVPALMAWTDALLAPILAVTDRFEVVGLAEDLASATESTVSGPEEFEPVVLVAMVLWGLAAVFVLFVLRLIFRPAG